MWIEIISALYVFAFSIVTPFAGVWIEISKSSIFFIIGLVTPFAGVWIEIDDATDAIEGVGGHSLRGSVD